MMGVWIFVGFAFLALAVTVVQWRSKAGPGVRWFPRRARPWVNDFYSSHGWAEPYDAEGNKRPRHERAHQ